MKMFLPYVVLSTFLAGSTIAWDHYGQGIWDQGNQGYWDLGNWDLGEWGDWGQGGLDNKPEQDPSTDLSPQDYEKMSCLSESTSMILCVGSAESDFSQRLAAAKDATDTESFGLAMKWINSTHQIDRGNVKKDIASSNLRESMRQPEEQCAKEHQRKVEHYIECVVFAFDEACMKRAEGVLAQNKFDTYSKKWTQFQDQDNKTYSKVWQYEGFVPDFFPQVPPPLMVTFTSGSTGSVGAVMRTGEMQDPPQVYWDADPNTLYTLIGQDYGSDLAGFPNLRVTSYMVYNIPGNDLSQGTVALEWYPPFVMRINAETTPITFDPSDWATAHPHTFQVWRQEERIADDSVDTSFGCDGWDARMVNAEDLAKKHKLSELVAATFFIVPSSQSCLPQVCKFKRCDPQEVLKDIIVPGCDV